jgi:hypothetical protein
MIVFVWLTALNEGEYHAKSFKLCASFLCMKSARLGGVGSKKGHQGQGDSQVRAERIVPYNETTRALSPNSR